MSTLSSSDNELKIVVIDHSNLSRKRTIDFLEEEKFNVIGQAKSAEDALQFLTNDGANLFIVDLVMPEISGIDLIKMLSEKMMSVNIIMMSSIQSNHLAIECFTNGAFDFLEKPILKNELLKSVKKVQQTIQSDS